MEFTEFIQKIKPIIGGSYTTHTFTRVMFEEIITYNGSLEIEDISDNTLKAYYNGKTKITKIAQRILPYVEPEQFASYLYDFPEATIQRLSDAFKSDIEGITPHNACEKIAYYFEEILTFNAAQKRHINNKNEKKSGSLKLPEEHTTRSPYSAEDNLLLNEFTADYDEIMMSLIGENYAVALLDMTLPTKINSLYESKWCLKADDFLDPSLKSYVFALLGELNNISKDCCDGSLTPFPIDARAKIRNLYVHLHPDKFEEIFPYDAFIDDWEYGEF